MKCCVLSRMVLVILAMLLTWHPAAPFHGMAEAATNPDEVLSDPVLEQRARALGKELRCLVCQNQSIDDSNAGLARDLRRIVRERLLAGDSDDEVIAYIKARYGDFVMLRPPMTPATWGLWYGPFAILLIAGAFLAAFLRRLRYSTARRQPVPLSPEEEAKFARLVTKDTDVVRL